jgi:hypothetical protein
MKKQFVGFVLILAIASCGGQPGRRLTLQNGPIAFTGTWRMSKVSQLGVFGSTPLSCTDSTISIAQTATSLKLGSYTIQCSDSQNGYSETSQEWNFVVSGSSLIWQEVPAGQIGSQFIHVSLTITMANGQTNTLVISLDPDGAGLAYVNNLASTVITRGHLEKQ